jgi:hypothetical protein
VALTEEEKRERKRAYGKAYRQRNPEKERARGKRWRANNPEKVQAKDKAWIAKNYEHKRATEKAWRDKNPERKLAAVYAWRDKNQDRARSVLDAWRKNNPDKVRAAAKRAQAKAAASPAKKLQSLVKWRLNAILKGKASRTTTIRTFGYAMEDLVAHLEAQFVGGMSWQSYGMKGWHVDHIRAVASFVFIREDGTVDHDQVRECYALENLRPLWAVDNMRKGARLLT